MDLQNEGIEFELYVKDILERNGIYAKTTPASGDYGADLVFSYSGYTFCVQCKNYQSSVGIKAVQEVLGSLSYYHGDYGIVVTNSFFTQAAIRQAASAGVLLIDGNRLSNFKIEYLDSMINKSSSGLTRNQITDDWNMDDMVARYQVSRSTVVKNYIGSGCPYYKIGNRYAFDPEEVKKWEISQGHINNHELPAWVEKKAELKQALKHARENGDNEQSKNIKNELKYYHMIRPIFGVTSVPIPFISDVSDFITSSCLKISSSYE